MKKFLTTLLASFVFAGMAFAADAPAAPACPPNCDKPCCKKDVKCEKDCQKPCCKKADAAMGTCPMGGDKAHSKAMAAECPMNKECKPGCDKDPVACKACCEKAGDKKCCKDMAAAHCDKDAAKKACCDKDKPAAAPVAK